MKCKECPKQAIFDNPNYCKNHFINYIEQTVQNTIKKFNLINKEDKVCVAASGGKDSLTVLSILNKHYNVTALAINEGIKDYRDETLEDLKEYCNKNKIKLNIFSYLKEFNKQLDNMKLHGKPHCSICGTLRRFLLNKHSSDFDVIATGHNLDDEAQAITMNFLKPNFGLTQRIGPKTGTIESNNFTKRVKPLYFLNEKEIRAYTILKGIKTNFTECPHLHSSFRSKVRTQLDLLENKHPGSKRNLINNFLKLKKKIPIEEKDLNHCQKCGFISKENICRTCQILAEI